MHPDILIPDNSLVSNLHPLSVLLIVQDSTKWYISLGPSQRSCWLLPSPDLLQANVRRQRVGCLNKEAELPHYNNHLLFLQALQVCAMVITKFFSLSSIMSLILLGLSHKCELFYSLLQSLLISAMPTRWPVQ